MESKKLALVLFALLSLVMAGCFGLVKAGIITIGY